MFCHSVVLYNSPCRKYHHSVIMLYNSPCGNYLHSVIIITLLEIPALSYNYNSPYWKYLHSVIIIRGFAKKGYTSLFLRQKGAHLKNIWAIYTKRSMISYCTPFWRKNTGEYPPVSIQLNMYPLFAVEITPFWRKHDIISGAK